VNFLEPVGGGIPVSVCAASLRIRFLASERGRSLALPTGQQPAQCRRGELPRTAMWGAAWGRSRMCHDPTLGESRVGCLHPTRRFTRVICLDESALRCRAPDRRLNDAELAALRRLATLVAGGVSPDECFAAVATEMANCLGVDKAEVFRSEDDGAVIAVACHVSPGIAHIAIGERNHRRRSQDCHRASAHRLRQHD
jgi:hypothetical protein